MLTCCLSLSVFLALFALVAAEALPPDAVPVMCAAICGPVVELSSMCSPKRSLGRLESGQLDREAYPRQIEWFDDGRFEQIEQIERRFVVIVPAPTTFPPGLLDSLYSPESSPAPIPPLPPASWSQSSSSSSSCSPILPSQSSPSIPPPAQALLTTSDNVPPTAAEAASPPAPTPTIASNAQPITSSTAIDTGTKALGLPTTPATSSSHPTSIFPTILGSDGNDGGETGGWEKTENAEEKCVCLNDSFNVAEVAGLCASCISMIADTQNDMEVIMSVCGFPPQQYSPDKDSLASNIWVKATRPTAAYAGSAKLNGASRSTRIASLGPVVGVSCFIIGALTML